MNTLERLVYVALNDYAQNIKVNGVVYDRVKERFLIAFEGYDIDISYSMPEVMYLIEESKLVTDTINEMYADKLAKELGYLEPEVQCDCTPCDVQPSYDNDDEAQAESDEFVLALVIDDVIVIV